MAVTIKIGHKNISAVRDNAKSIPRFITCWSIESPLFLDRRSGVSNKCKLSELLIITSEIFGVE
jgi:hypothetical protein